MAISGETAVQSGIESDVALAARGDSSAFERLYRTHVNRIHNLTRRMLGSHEADEVTQDIFVRTWQKLGQFRGDAAFSTWLHRLAVNVVFNEQRTTSRRERRVTPAADPAVLEQNPRGPLEVSSIDLERAIAELPDGAREVFVLFDIEGYGHGEIAELTGIAEGTSKAQLFRARRLLQEKLER